MTRTLIIIAALAALAALGEFMVGAVIPLGRLFVMYNIEQVPRMCGTPGDYQPCKVQP